MIDRCFWPGRVCCSWGRHSMQAAVGPMLAVVGGDDHLARSLWCGERRFRPGGSVLDPLAENLDLIGGEGVFLGGHPLVEVGGGDAADQFAAAGISGIDSSFAGVAGSEGVSLVVEAEAAFLFFGAVAFEAMLLEDRKYVAREIDAKLFAASRSRGQKQTQEEGYWCFLHYRILPPRPHAVAIIQACRAARRLAAM